MLVQHDTKMDPRSKERFSLLSRNKVRPKTQDIVQPAITEHVHMRGQGALVDDNHLARFAELYHVVKENLPKSIETSDMDTQTMKLMASDQSKPSAAVMLPESPVKVQTPPKQRQS